MSWRARLARRGIFIAIAALALAGSGVSGYLLYSRWTGSELVCTVGGGCATVQSSEYAEVAGLPVALLGLLLYLTLASGVLVAVRWPRPWVVSALFTVALSGFFYSAYLTYLELRVIDAICVWCVVSAAIVTVITALLAVAALREPGPLGKVGT